MITHDEINSRVSSFELTEDEKAILARFDQICSDKIENNFASSDTVYVGEVLFFDVFRSAGTLGKRKKIIIEHLKANAVDDGWKIELIDEYYNITPLGCKNT